MPRSLALLVALACLAGSGCSNLLNTPLPGDEASEPDAAPAGDLGAVLDAVNALRARGATCGAERFPPASPVVWEGRLARAAAVHTADMAAHEHFDHVGTDGSTVGERVSRAGYDWRRVGENIALARVEAAHVVELWARSPGHCANLMNASFSQMGAAADGGYWTQVLGRPR